MRAPGGYTSLPATTCYTSASARSRRLTPSKTAKKSMACPRRGGPHAFSTRESQACLSGSDRPGFEACVAYGGRVLQHARQCTAEERTDAALLAHLCPKARPAWPGGGGSAAQQGRLAEAGGGWRRDLGVVSRPEPPGVPRGGGRNRARALRGYADCAAVPVEELGVDHRDLINDQAAHLAPELCGGLAAHVAEGLRRAVRHARAGPACGQGVDRVWIGCAWWAK